MVGVRENQNGWENNNDRYLFCTKIFPAILSTHYEPLSLQGSRIFLLTSKMSKFSVFVFYYTQLSTAPLLFLLPMLSYLLPPVYREALMGRPAGLAAKREKMFWRVPVPGCVVMTASGLVIMTRNAEVMLQECRGILTEGGGIGGNKKVESRQIKITLSNRQLKEQNEILIFSLLVSNKLTQSLIFGLSTDSVTTEGKLATLKRFEC